MIPKPATTGKVYILLLNWNGWQDTIECLESVFRLDYPDFRVIVCDNASTDGSVERFKAWAEGTQSAMVPEYHPLYALSHPPVGKPIKVIEYDRSTAEMGGIADDAARLVLIRTGSNLGFAGGNNVGLRYVQAKDDFDFVWLLNNDTVVRPDSLSQMMQRMTERPDAGICGALLPYYDAPDVIWTAGGGTFNRWLAKSCSLDDRAQLSSASSTDVIERRMVYVAGASMFVSKAFLHDVGLLWEDYFLYFEEPDWCFRGRKQGYSLVYANRAVVYHKVGISTARLVSGPNQTAENYFFRSQILITSRFLPVALPLVLLRVLINRLKSAFRRLLLRGRQVS